uniref:Reverse transcriptase domain-containing protein n=1 Tax=Tanacetum cinerariifolium TaxID=118510 RepID=A0A699JZV4_TANCI|nr:reverse transcriptase domain-containing protein [Tanacetum cinerariifolium]
MPFGLCKAPGTFQREGIVLGHKISKFGIEVDRVKVDVIARLPHPTTVKGNFIKKGLTSQQEKKFFKDACKNYVIYKERTKKLHDSKIKNRIFNIGDQVLLFNSRHKIFLRKLKTRWSGPFTITQVFPYGTVELSQPNGPNFKVNGHCVKHYFGGDIPSNDVSDLYTFPMDK